MRSILTRYATKNRCFALVDIVIYPEIAEDLNISTNGTSKQLPTLALFAGGRCDYMGTALLRENELLSILIINNMTGLFSEIPLYFIA